jgi:hypothetical protein
MALKLLLFDKWYINYVLNFVLTQQSSGLHLSYSKYNAPTKGQNIQSNDKDPPGVCPAPKTFQVWSQPLAREYFLQNNYAVIKLLQEF